MFAFTLFETGSLHWILFLPWSTHYRHCQTHKWALVMTRTWTQPPLINIFLLGLATVRMNLTRVTALEKMILRLLTMMGGMCYCSGLNGDPNDVIHYSAERGCRILWASRAFPQAPGPAFWLMTSWHLGRNCLRGKALCLLLLNAILLPKKKTSTHLKFSNNNGHNKFRTPWFFRSPGFFPLK